MTPEELAACAERAERATLKRNERDPESRDFWAFVDQTAAEVATWPRWKRGEQEAP